MGTHITIDNLFWYGFLACRIDIPSFIVLLVSFSWLLVFSPWTPFIFLWLVLCGNWSGFMLRERGKSCHAARSFTGFRGCRCNSLKIR
jgi:hypothetical protein